nr:hypothetical protein [Tanacetum cinerariifolium]
ENAVDKKGPIFRAVPNNVPQYYKRIRGTVTASFGVYAVEDFKKFTLRDYYCWLKTYCCWYKLKLLDNAADSRLRLLEQSVAVDDKMKK